MDNKNHLEKHDVEQLDGSAKDCVSKENSRTDSKKINPIHILKKTIVYTLLLFVYILTLQGIRINSDPEYIPSILGNTYLNVLTESMAPEFKSNDLIIGKKVKDSSTINSGDIITYRQGRVLVSHRVIEVLDNGKSFRTKGDANNNADANIVSAENVVSKQLTTIPKGGYVASKFQSMAFIGLVCAIFMWFIFKELFIEIRKEKLKKRKQKVLEA
ncbi:MAG: signal peptidase I [Clostridium sp.]